MSQFANSIKQVAKSYGKYDDWEQAQADRKARKEYLAANTTVPADVLERTQKRAEAVVRATEIMDARSEDNCENMEQLTGIYAMVPAIALSTLQAPITLKATKKATAKTDAQIEELKQEIKKLTDSQLIEQKKNELKTLNIQRQKAYSRTNYLYGGVFVALAMATGIGMILWGNSKQKEASRIGRFQAKRNELSGIENFVIYTPEQIAQAEEIAKKIPDNKEKDGLQKMISELKELKKDKAAYQLWHQNRDTEEINKLKTIELDTEERIKAEADKELIVDTVKEINIKAEEYSENLENAYDTLTTLSGLIAIPFGFAINRLLKLFKVNPKVNLVTSILTPTAVSLWIAISGTAAQKEASRVGRYQARKDLLANPARLMVFSDEDMKKAEDIKAKPQKHNLLKKIGQSFIFLKTYSKDKKEYKNYKEVTQKNNEKLQKAFKAIEVTDSQAKEAKELQTKVFRAFDEVDEMSQRYSEDVEAGCEIAKQVGSTFWEIGWIAASAAVVASVMSGKFPLVKLANKLTNWTFKPESSIKKSINNLNDTLSGKGKTTTKEFQKALIEGRMKEFLKKPENKEISDALETIKNEAQKISNEGIKKPLKNKNTEKHIDGSVGDIMETHLKQTKAAKWSRNMIGEIAKIVSKSKASKYGVDLTPEMEQELGLNFNYKNYKTIINTSLVAGLPILGIIFGIPYAFNAWLTDIQKKAGKIGVMKAVENLDAPGVFADEKALLQIKQI